MTETILSNARLVIDREVLTGTIVLRDGVIAAIDTGVRVASGATDCEGDLVIPGLVELHTDNLERHIAPRPGVDWPHEAAILAHDAELAACGITTVFDALRVGSITLPSGLGYKKYARPLASEIAALRAGGHLRISHHLHLRAEICSETLIAELDEFGADDRVGLVSLMDHTPGQRQFADISKFAQYIQGKYGLPDSEFDVYVSDLMAIQADKGASHEVEAVAAAARFGAALASHDDTTAEQVRISARHGVRLAEFPTTVGAARACHEAGISVMMGAPNLVRGGSHSGNVAAADLAAAGLLDVLSSDYVPAALLGGALQLARLWDDLPAGIAAVTSAPARAVGLNDRGRLVPGLRADVVRLRESEDFARLRGVWAAGNRVA